jgi:hypothetical protein
LIYMHEDGVLQKNFKNFKKIVLSLDVPILRGSAAFAQPGSGPAQLRLRPAHPVYAPRRSQDPSPQKSSTFNEGSERCPPQAPTSRPLIRRAEFLTTMGPQLEQSFCWGVGYSTSLHQPTCNNSIISGFGTYRLNILEFQVANLFLTSYQLCRRSTRWS